MTNPDPDLEWDGIAPPPPRNTGTHENYDSAITSSESSESISERASLLDSDNKQVGNYKSTEIGGAEQDFAEEGEGAVKVQKTPKAIAAVISVLLVGN